jgi:hypothetical protein
MEPFDPLKHVPEHIRLGQKGPNPPTVPHSRALPECWTRVLCLTHGPLFLNSQFNIAEDLRWEQEEDAERDPIMLEGDVIHFDPDEFQKQFKPLTLERFGLSSIQMYTNAVQVIAARSEFLGRAKAVDDWVRL